MCLLHRSKTISFPIFWEDGAYLYNYDGFDYGTFYHRFMCQGLKVINMHPMHLMLNTPYFKYTREIKDSLSREEWGHLDEAFICKMCYPGEGITTFIERMLDDICTQNLEAIYLEDVYDWICGL